MARYKLLSGDKVFTANGKTVQAGADGWLRPADKAMELAMIHAGAIPAGIVYSEDPIGVARPFGCGTVQIGASVVVNALNADVFNGKILEFMGAYTVTLSVGLPPSFGFAAFPPVAGNATIASDGTATIDTATASITRAAAGNKLFAIVQRDSDHNAYVSTGS